jgi:hypothetical protein
MSKHFHLFASTLVIWQVFFSLCAIGADSVVLENEKLRVEFSRADGSILGIRNKTCDLELITQKRPVPRGWAMLLDGTKLVSDFTELKLTTDDEKSPTKVHFEWQTPYDITVVADAELTASSDELRLRCEAKNNGTHAIIALRCPDIQGVGMLSAEGANDELLHSTMMGAVFHDPFHLFVHDGMPLQARGMVVSRYPNGFHGSATQLMAYFEKGRGGFYIAAEDGTATDKDFNFFKATPDSLSCEVAHFNWDARPGKDLAMDYPVVIAAMTEGSWYEAAERYRRWATKQPWCQRGTTRERIEKGDASRWLNEETGIVSMWWPFRQDIRSQVRTTKEIFQCPTLHLELWWRHQASVEASRAQGDRFGPFYFPNLALKGTKTFEDHRKDAIAPSTFSITPDWIAMCCSQRGWRTVFAESAEDMVGHDAAHHEQIWMEDNPKGCDADMLYFDIGPCAGIPTHCYAADHDHPPGAGRQITEGHLSLLQESQQRASRRKGTYVPLGTECISEPFLAAYDMHYPRNAGFGLDMELVPYVRQLTWLPDGKMETVPLFAFVYHEYGPLAVQGVHSADFWNSPESEAINTWAESRAYLWGGIMTTPLPPVDFKPSAQRLRFLRSLTAARTNFAKEYLAYGRMERPPSLRETKIELDHGLADGGWLRKLRFTDVKTAAKAVGIASAEDDVEREKTDGTELPKLAVEQWVKDMLAIGATPAKTTHISVPSVQSGAFTTSDGRLGILVVNLDGEKPTTIEIPANYIKQHVREKVVQLRRTTVDASAVREFVLDNKSVSLDLPPREVMLLEVLP